MTRSARSRSAAEESRGLLFEFKKEVVVLLLMWLATTFAAYMELKAVARDVALIKSWTHLHEPDETVLMLDAPDWSKGGD